MLTFISDYLRNVRVYFLKNKNDIFLTFKTWKIMIDNQTDKKVKWLRTDNGLEFCQFSFNKFCESEVIVEHHTADGTP